MNKIEDFWAQRFSSLSLSSFVSNTSLAEDSQVPSFSDSSWKGLGYPSTQNTSGQITSNGNIFASSIAVTRDNFYNRPHRDKDASHHVFGLFALINRKTGRLMNSDTPHVGCIVGATFCLQEYDAGVSFDMCNGVTEVSWASQVPHFTIQSTTYNGKMKKIDPKKSGITRFGSSAQISAKLLKKSQVLKDFRAGMTTQQWEAFSKAEINSYDHVIQCKLDKFSD